MKNIVVPIPDSLHKRIERRAEAIKRTVPELVSLWLWDYEESQRARESRGQQPDSNRQGVGDGRGCAADDDAGL
jgi:hypothetical protein